MDRIRQSSLANDSITKITVAQLEDSLKAKLKVINTAHAALEAAIPLGWTRSEFSADKEWYEWVLHWFFKLIGMTLTVLAIMMGAPFWFDILNKVANVRGTGKKPDEKGKT